MINRRVGRMSVFLTEPIKRKGSNGLHLDKIVRSTGAFIIQVQSAALG